jgi:hypothetical protein
LSNELTLRPEFLTSARPLVEKGRGRVASVVSAELLRLHSKSDLIRTAKEKEQDPSKCVLWKTLTVWSAYFCQWNRFVTGVRMQAHIPNKLSCLCKRTRRPHRVQLRAI